MDDPYGPDSTLPGAAMNTSLTDHVESAGSVGSKLLLEFFAVLMCAFALIGNTLVIAIVATAKAFHRLDSVLIVNLAISDLLVGVGVMPFVALSIMNNSWADNTFLCFYAGYTSSVYCMASVLTLTVITLDRYYSIVDCLHYRAVATPRRTAAAVALIWLQALLISAPPLLGWCSLRYVGPIYNCGVHWAGNPAYTVCVAVLCYLVPGAVILFCYLSIFRVARSHVKRIHSLADSVNRVPAGDSSRLPPERSLRRPSGQVWHVDGQFEAASSTDSAPPGSPPAPNSSLTSLQSSQQPQNPQYSGGVVRLLLITSAFFLCYTPYIVVCLVQTADSAISGQSRGVPPAAVTSSYFLVLLNSAINPFVHALLCRRFRVALRELMRRMRAQLRSVLDWGGWSRTKEGNKLRYPRTLTNNQPRPSSSSETVTTDDAKCCTPVFTITGMDNMSQQHLCNVHDCEKASRSSQVDYLYVPPSPQEGSRLPFSALTTERLATFYFGEITVRVEHDVC